MDECIFLLAKAGASRLVWNVFGSIGLCHMSWDNRVSTLNCKAYKSIQAFHKYYTFQHNFKARVQQSAHSVSGFMGVDDLNGRINR